MKRFNWKIGLVTVFFFVVPTLAIPHTGTMENDVLMFSYGFPFQWISVSFSARGGRAFLVQILSEPFQNLHFDFLTAVLNLIIIYAVLSSILHVFRPKWLRFLRTNHTKKEDDPPPPVIPTLPTADKTDGPDEQSKECSPPAEKM